jgi:hypothetical protein
VNIHTIVLVAMALVPLVFFDGVGASPSEDGLEAAALTEWVRPGLAGDAPTCVPAACTAAAGGPGAGGDPDTQKEWWIVLVAAADCPGQRQTQAVTADLHGAPSSPHTRTLIF